VKILTMMDWENLRHFAALAAGGTLLAAARQLGVEHATVARRTAALEDELGLKLIDRRGRRLVLTTDGERIAAIVGRMEKDAGAITRAADGARSQLAGEVTISAPPALAAASLTAPLVALHKQHPALTIRVIGESRSASLERREADIAIRLSRPEAGDLTLTKLGDVSFRFYASPTYLIGTTEAEWRFIGYDASMGRAPQQVALAKIASGRPFVFRSNDLEIQQAAARAGAGVAILPDFMAATDSDLVLVAPDVPPLLRGIWLLVHSDMKEAAPIRAVVRCLREAFVGWPDR
jgi:DNA-binding transcriptional LysR family regulator